MKRLIGRVKQANKDFLLIQPEDVIAVGVSGGKDSVALLYALHLYQKSCGFNFKVIGINIMMGFPDMDFQEINDFCLKNHIEFYQEPSQIAAILYKQQNDDGTLKCSLCSKFKKAAVIKGAKKYGCNKVAFAHHSDDAVETLLMNAIFGGRLATFLPSMYLDREEITFIRPFIYCYEQDIIQAVQRNQLPLAISTCPMDKHTERENTKQLLQQLYQRYPQAQQNFQRMLSNQKQLQLWQIIGEESIK